MVSLRHDFYNWTYDDAVPAFITTGTPFVVYRKGSFDLIHIDTLIEQCKAMGYNLAAPEIGDAPQWWKDSHAAPAGYVWLPGYGTGTDPEAPFAPINVEMPRLGETYTGFTAFCQDGVWYGVPEPTLTYAWYVNDVLDGGETGSTYPNVVEGSTYRCDVTATNPSGSVTVSTNTILASAAPELPWIPPGPGIITQPVISGLVVPNGTLTLTQPPVWDGTESTSGWVWQADGVNIVGTEDAVTYDLPSTDLAGYRVRAIATNADGARSVVSNTLAQERTAPYAPTDNMWALAPK